MTLEQGIKSHVYCELSYIYCEDKKIIHFVVYQSRKCRKILYTFIIIIFSYPLTQQNKRKLLSGKDYDVDGLHFDCRS